MTDEPERYYILTVYYPHSDRPLYYKYERFDTAIANLAFAVACQMIGKNELLVRFDGAGVRVFDPVDRSELLSAWVRISPPDPTAKGAVT